MNIKFILSAIIFLTILTNCHNSSVLDHYGIYIVDADKTTEIKSSNFEPVMGKFEYPEEYNGCNIQTIWLNNENDSSFNCRILAYGLETHTSEFKLLNNLNYEAEYFDCRGCNEIRFLESPSKKNETRQFDLKVKTGKYCFYDKSRSKGYLFQVADKKIWNGIQPIIANGSASIKKDDIESFIVKYHDKKIIEKYKTDGRFNIGLSSIIDSIYPQYKNGQISENYTEFWNELLKGNPWWVILDNKILFLCQNKYCKEPFRQITFQRDTVTNKWYIGNAPFLLQIDKVEIPVNNLKTPLKSKISDFIISPAGESGGIPWECFDPKIGKYCMTVNKIDSTKCSVAIYMCDDGEPVNSIIAAYEDNKLVNKDVGLSMAFYTDMSSLFVQIKGPYTQMNKHDNEIRFTNTNLNFTK